MKLLDDCYLMIRAAYDLVLQLFRRQAVKGRCNSLFTNYNVAYSQHRPIQTTGCSTNPLNSTITSGHTPFTPYVKNNLKFDASPKQKIFGNFGSNWRVLTVLSFENLSWVKELIVVGTVWSHCWLDAWLPIELHVINFFLQRFNQGVET